MRIGMKRCAAMLIVLLALCLLMSSCGKSDPFFREVSWGMSPTEVDKAEHEQGLMWEEYGLYTVANQVQYGYSCGISYEFSDEKLSRIVVSFDDISDTKFGRIYDAVVAEMGSEGNVLECFENPILPLLKVEWVTDNAVMTVTYCDGTELVKKSASIEYSPVE